MNNTQSKGQTSHSVLKRVLVVLFLLVLFTPAVLGYLADTYKLPYDVPLKGFTDSAEKPELTWDNYISGEYQGNYTSWFDTELKPRGVLTKTYASIRHDLFNQGTQIIGKNNDLFESHYINCELCIDGGADFSLPENRARMESFVQKLETLQKQLSKHGKKLYIYVVADKTAFYKDNIPAKYFGLSNESSVPAIKYFLELLEQSSVPYLDSYEIGQVLEYPTYYTTSTHWSKPFEQKVSQRVLDDLIQLTNKSYRPLLLGEMQTSSDPYWRDSDLHNLLNVWNQPDITYYEYAMDSDYPDSYDPLKVLIHGTSFSLGLRKDLLDVFPCEDVYYINRNEYLHEHGNPRYDFDGAWENVPLSKYLDSVDAIVMEFIAPTFSTTDFSYGFVDQLLQVLETYVPQTHISSMSALEFESGTPWDSFFMKGFNDKEQAHVWTTKQARIQLKDEAIGENGLQVDLTVSDNLFAVTEVPEVYIYVNGKKVYTAAYQEPGTHSIRIDSKTLEEAGAKDGVYNIDIMCSDYFVPAELGLNEDTRNLALMIHYIGRAK